MRAGDEGRRAGRGAWRPGRRAKTGSHHPKGGRRTSIGTKLAAATTALIIVVTGVVYFKLTHYQRENLLHSKEVAASAVSRLFSDWCVAGVVFEDDAAITEAVTTLGRNEEVEYAAVWAVSPAGVRGRRLGELQRGKSESLPAVVRDTQIERRADRVVVTAPVRDHDGNIAAVAVVAFSLAPENAAIAQVEKSALGASVAVAVGFILILKWITTIAISLPLKKLVVAAQQVEAGGRAQLDVHTTDEVGQLAHAFRSMASAIQVREERINSGNRDMRLVLDNVGQGFVTLDRDGAMSAERSRAVDTWFGVPDGSPKFWDYLHRINPLLGDLFELGWAALGENVLPLDLCLEQLPRLAHKDDQTFELAYRPIVENDHVTKLIVVITDVTARIERERAEQAQREMMSIFRRVLSDRVALDQFFFEADALVASVTASPAVAAGVDGFDPAVLRRQLHTLKGNCAVFGIESVANLCHQLENRLSDAPDPLSTDETSSLRAEWERVRLMHAQLTAGRPDGAIELERSQFEAFVSSLRNRLGDDALVGEVTAWQFEPASKRLQVIAEQVRVLALRLEKAPIETVCEPTELRLPPERWAPFWSAFAHVVRNVVDHGVETTEQRRSAGKDLSATVTLGMNRVGGQVVVTIADDGRGIDWEKISERARDRGFPHTTRDELEEALFLDGISTRDEVTTTSGRGVGMGAARQVVQELGGHITIDTAPGLGTTFRFVLPATMLFDDLSRTQAPEPMHARGRLEKRPDNPFRTEGKTLPRAT